MPTDPLVQLEHLSARLRAAGLTAALVRRAGDWPHLDVVNPSAPALNEDLTAAPDADGVWWLWSSWQQPLAQVADIDEAYAKLIRILSVHPSQTERRA